MAAIVLCACQKVSNTPEQEASSTSISATVRETINSSPQPEIPTAGIPPTSEAEGGKSISRSTGTTSPAESVHSQSVITYKTTGSTPSYTSNKSSTVTESSGKGSTSGSSNSNSTVTIAAATTTSVAEKSPWVYPYNINAILQECKKEIARIEESTGWTWDDSLSKDRSSWDHPHNTGVYTEYPDMFNLKAYIMDEMIPFYAKNQDRYAIKRCKIWFEPDAQYPGDYNIYFLYRPDFA